MLEDLRVREGWDATGPMGEGRAGFVSLPLNAY